MRNHGSEGPAQLHHFVDGGLFGQLGLRLVQQSLDLLLPFGEEALPPTAERVLESEDEAVEGGELGITQTSEGIVVVARHLLLQLLQLLLFIFGHFHWLGHLVGLHQEDFLNLFESEGHGGVGRDEQTDEGDDDIGDSSQVSNQVDQSIRLTSVNLDFSVQFQIDSSQNIVLIVTFLLLVRDLTGWLYDIVLVGHSADVE